MTHLFRSALRPVPLALALLAGLIAWTPERAEAQTTADWRYAYCSAAVNAGRNQPVAYYVTPLFPVTAGFDKSAFYDYIKKAHPMPSPGWVNPRCDGSATREQARRYRDDHIVGITPHFKGLIKHLDWKPGATTAANTGSAEVSTAGRNVSADGAEREEELVRAAEARRRADQAAAIAAAEARRAELSAVMDSRRAEYLARIEARKRACAAGNKSQCGARGTPQ